MTERNVGGGAVEVTTGRTTAGFSLSEAEWEAPPVHIPDGHGAYVRAEPDAAFMAALEAINPHLRNRKC